MSRVTSVWVPDASAIVGVLTIQSPPHTNEPLSTMRSPAFNDACAPARTDVCVQGAPVVVVPDDPEEPDPDEPDPDEPDPDGAAGAGTCVQFGVPLVLAAASAALVWGPTMPSTCTLA